MLAPLPKLEILIVLLVKYVPTFTLPIDPLKSPKVEFFPNSTSKLFPLTTLKVLENLVASEEYSPTAPFPIFNFEFCPKFTLAFPSEYIPIVVPALTPVPLSDRTIGAFIFKVPFVFLAKIPKPLVPTLIVAELPS